MVYTKVSLLLYVNSKRPELDMSSIVSIIIKPHFIHESKTIAYDVIDVNIFQLKLMRFHLKKRPNWCALNY